ncbi:nucleoside kinase [Kribbella endophytica]
MAERNYLVEGGSGTGKSSVLRELRRRGYQAIDGDNELAYQGDPSTGEPLEGPGSYEHHIWNVPQVREIAASDTEEIAFFCGGSRNHSQFLDLFDQIFVLDVDLETLKHRLALREADDWGGNDAQKAFILSLHPTRAGVPHGTIINTNRPLPEVVDAILEAIR